MSVNISQLFFRLPLEGGFRGELYLDFWEWDCYCNVIVKALNLLKLLGERSAKSVLSVLVV